MEVIWNGTRGKGLNPSLYDLGRPYEPPILGTLPNSDLSFGLGQTKDAIIRLLSRVAEASVGDIAAAFGVEYDPQAKQRINQMAYKLHHAGLLVSRREARTTPDGKPYRCNVYSLPGRERIIGGQA